jgi:hypothetical protein
MPAYSTPLSVLAVPGAVIVGHPHAASLVAITPEAALLSAEQLVQAARLATTLPPMEVGDEDFGEEEADRP